MPRRSLFASLLLAFLFAVSCQDDPASLPSDPGELGLSGRGTCSAAPLIEDLFPRGLANAATQQCRNIQRQYARGEVEDAYDKLAALTAFVMEHFDNGRLMDPPGPLTEASGAAALIVQLNMIVGLADATVEIPADAFTSEGGAVELLDAEEEWDVETGDGFAGITKAAGVPVFLDGEPYTGPVTLFIAPIDPSESGFPGFGLEIGGANRAAFPLFKDMGTVPAGLTFGDGDLGEIPDPANELVVELCIVDPPHPLAPFPGQLPDLRVGHIHEGEVEVTPLRDSTLDCTDVNDEVPTIAMFENQWHRWANVALGPVARLLDVARLQAEPGRLGGSISSFSEFGGVDRTQVNGVRIFFESGFENSDPTWTLPSWVTENSVFGILPWVRTTGVGITNTAYPTYVSLGAGDLSGGSLPSPSEGSQYLWAGQPSTGNYIGTQAPDDTPKSGGTSTDNIRMAMESPDFVIPADAAAATLVMDVWFEIESVEGGAPFGVDAIRVVVCCHPSGNPNLDVFPHYTEAGQDDIPWTSRGFNRAPIFRRVELSLDNRIRETDTVTAIEFDFETGPPFTVGLLRNGFRGVIIDNVKVVERSADPALHPDVVFAP